MSVEVVAHADIEGQATLVRFDILLRDELVASEVAVTSDLHASAMFRTQNPELWYPRGYGKQPLYTLRATLLSALQGQESCLDTKSKRFGIRTATVIQQSLSSPSSGSSFFFLVNNIPIFCGGSNWIPADTFIPSVSRSSYQKLIGLAAEGNQLMLRVWGGGIYEEDAFYSNCDEFGILVWQDFMFACGNYPASISEFRQSVEKEATANIKRLRHHPCIVLWAGNNEDYQVAESEGLDYDPKSHNPESWLRGSFSARYIYEKLLVDITRDLIPDTYYHPGSPWGGKTTRDDTVGDIHQWNGTYARISCLILRTLPIPHLPELTLCYSSISMARSATPLPSLRAALGPLRFRIRDASLPFALHNQHLPPRSLRH